MYEFTFENFQLTKEKYVEFMKNLNDEVADIGNDAKNRNLAINMLYYSSWVLDTKINSDNFNQRLMMSG